MKKGIVLINKMAKFQKMMRRNLKKDQNIKIKITYKKAAQKILTSFQKLRQLIYTLL